jgi:glycosyltransferase involved in cell wall biosynthesis
MRICIVTPGYLVSTPRVVKEAEALSEAGHEVMVLHTHGPLKQLAQWDEELYSHRPWKRVVVRWDQCGAGGHVRFWAGAVTEKLSQLLAPDGGWGPSWAAWAEFRGAPFLAALAGRHKADLYIGHYPAGLHAAGEAALRHGAKLAFDAEDLHIGEFGPEQSAEAALRHPRARRIHRIEREWLPQCAYATASSAGIAEALAQVYSVPKPVVVYNTFAPSIAPFKERADDGVLRLAWFSQRIGPGRGLEVLVEAVAQSSGVELHLRGMDSCGSIQALRALWKKHTQEDRLHFLPRCAPDELAPWLAQNDVGVACELPNTWNHDQAASNKMFQYLAAGLPVLASPTRGQLEVLRTVPGCVVAEAWEPQTVLQTIQDLKRLPCSATQRELLREAAREFHRAATGKITDAAGAMR